VAGGVLPKGVALLPMLNNTLANYIKYSFYISFINIGTGSYLELDLGHRCRASNIEPVTTPRLIYLSTSPRHGHSHETIRPSSAGLSFAERNAGPLASHGQLLERTARSSALSFSLNTGARVSEALSVRVQDVQKYD
jgi:hypothetical protein